MHESSLDTEDWVSCDEFELSDEARLILAAMEAAERAARSGPASVSVLDRIADLRALAGKLADQLPVAVLGLEPFEVLDAVQALQETVNVLGSCDQVIVAEIERRPDTIEQTGARSTAAWLAQTLRIRPAEAKRRVATANGCAPRVSLTGEPLPPVRPLVAAAQAAGQITTDHAHVIDRALSALPVGLPVQVVDTVEQSLLDEARRSNPTDVAKLGRDLRDRLDPDGPEPRDDQTRRRRDLRLTQNDDGTGTLHGELTAGLLAKLQTVLSPLAAPRPADGHGEDTRTPGQRLHDALDDVCDRLLRSGTLPDSGGVPATVCVRIDLADLETKTGRAHTSHGGDMSVAELLELAADAEIIPVVLNDAGGVMSYGRTRRFATPGQTKALIARDGHCTFPHCRIPPEWCQRHHVPAWLDDGVTAVDTMALLCGYHHRNHERWGWTCTMIDGMPWWTPPPEIDPDQKPQQNTSI